MEQSRMKLEENVFCNKDEIIIYTSSEEETKKVGKEIAKLIKEKKKKDNKLVHICLIGDLGVRKDEDNRRNIKRIWNGRSDIKPNIYDC